MLDIEKFPFPEPQCDVMWRWLWATMELRNPHQSGWLREGRTLQKEKFSKRRVMRFVSWAFLWLVMDFSNF